MAGSQKEHMHVSYYLQSVQICARFQQHIQCHDCHCFPQVLTCTRLFFSLPIFTQNALWPQIPLTARPECAQAAAASPPWKDRTTLSSRLNRVPRTWFRCTPTGPPRYVSTEEGEGSPDSQVLAGSCQVCQVCKIRCTLFSPSAIQAGACLHRVLLSMIIHTCKINQCLCQHCDITKNFQSGCETWVVRCSLIACWAEKI